MTSNSSLLRLNVGFIVHQNIGYSREFVFDTPYIRLPPDVNLADLRGVARVTRTPQGLLVQARMRGTLVSECVRCLTEFPQPLEIDFTELYAFSVRSVTDSNLILPEDGHIDLAPLAREYMVLATPISSLCREDCQGLCPICGQNLNEATCNHEAEEVDPRLAGLRSLLTKVK